MGLTNTYLIFYNLSSLLLWTSILGQTAIHLPRFNDSSATTTETISNLYTSILPLLQFTQSLALLEVVHVATGLVRAPLATTAVQIGGKNLVVWLVMTQFPTLIVGETAGTAGFVGCLLAWAASEVIRYGFFVGKLASGRGEAPAVLKWLRYNAFLVLYPIGLVSEATLVYLSLTKGEDLSTPYKIVAGTGLISYIPAGPYLYSHMLAQRRKA